jgi:hypothetical protein
MRKHNCSPKPLLGQGHYDDCSLSEPCTSSADVPNVCDTNNQELADNLLEASYLLKLRSHLRLTNCAVNEIVYETKLLFKEKIGRIKSKISNDYRSPEDSSAKEHFNVDIFKGLENSKAQDRFFHNHFGLITPVGIKLGERLIKKKKGLCGYARWIKITVRGYYVPFLKQLEKLLCMPEVHNILQKNDHTRNSTNIIMTDIQDGFYFQNHAFITAHPDCLVFSFFMDDYEIVNPIGSHRKKHKLTGLYWLLLNIPNSYRSKLSAIQLLGIVKVEDVKQFGITKIFEPFIADLCRLYHGVEFGSSVLRGKKWYGLLLFVLADTLAAQELGGFKVGVGKAMAPCRTCDIKKSDFNRVKHERDCDLRDEEEHYERCRQLGVYNLTHGQNDLATYRYWSQYWGVNRKSILCDIPDFKVTKCILQDPMHILLEGCLREEIHCLLHYLILEKKYITLNQLNWRIQNYSYSADELKDRPQTIELKQIQKLTKVNRKGPQGVKKKSPLSQSAASMKNLVIVLPFILMDYVPPTDKNWLNFLRCLQITMLALSPYASDNTISSLQYLISTYIHNFFKLYPKETFKPKLHYLVHFPSQMYHFGPLKFHSCFRFESKNGFFKSKRWNNFKNLPLSLSLFHQRWMCSQMISSDGCLSEVYLYSGDEVAEGDVGNISLLCQKYGDGLFVFLQQQLGFTLQKDFSDVMVTPKVAIHGITYKIGSVIVSELSELEGYPQLHQIVNIIIVGGYKTFFICFELNIKDYITEISSFDVTCTHSGTVQYRYIDFDNLTYVWPQICREYKSKTYVMLKHLDFFWSA